MKKYTFRVKAALLLLVALLTACSSKASSTSDIAFEEAEWAYDGGSYAPPAMNSIAETAPQTAAGEYMANMSDDAFAVDKAFEDSSESVVVEEKIIKTGYLEITVSDYDAAAGQIRDAVNAAGGYIESSNSYIYMTEADRSYRSGYMTVRIPADWYEGVKSQISSFGKLVRDNESSENVTQQYYDIDARLTVKRAEEKRLLEMIEKAEKIEDLILLEQRLGSVRTDIEIYESRLNSIDRLSSYSTINVSLSEKSEAVIEPVSSNLGERIKEAFIGSINMIKKFLESLIIAVAALIIPLIIIGVPVVVAVIVYKKRKSKGDDMDEKE